MMKTIKGIKLISAVKASFIFLVVILTLSCATSRQNPYYAKRSKASSLNASQLGRNKYFFSKTYQKKLYKSYRRR
ncbi:MAG: hypothetical protein HPY62_06910 [Bacteroidales bacterium]|nr:hypothetical protein [Bacteroidales bacterium]